MREFSVPPLAPPVTSGGLADSVFETAAEEPTTVFFGRKTSGTGAAEGAATGTTRGTAPQATWVDVTAAEFAAEVVALARGLIAKGIQPGDRVGIMARTCYEWALFDYAIWSVGAIGVPVYPTSSAEQVAWILGDSGAVAVVTETAEHAATVAAARPKLPGLAHVWRLDADAVRELCLAGSVVEPDEVARRRAAVTPDSPSTIVYTSGTTGRPKGCVITHGNFMAEVDNAIELLYPVFRSQVDDPASTLLFLPLAHVFGRMIQVGCVRARVKLSHAPSIAPADLLPDLAAVRPTFVLGVPYVFEKIYNTARATAEKMGRAASFDRAAAIAVRYATAREEQAAGRGRGPSLRLRLAHALYDRLVYRRVRAALGGRVRYAISGGSPLGRRLALFYAGAGVTVYEGYGLTETTAASTVNPPDRPKFGTVGRPLPGVTVRIADDGEILIRGGQVFTRYWNNEEATKQALDNGWFATGDLGELDDEGYLTITGRKKEIIVTSGGKNVVPSLLEDIVRAHPLVSHCMVIGDNRSFVAALVTLDAEALGHWKQMAGKPAEATPAELVADPDLRAEIQQAIDKANETVSRAESIRAFRILEVDFTEEAGHITPSLKLRRAAIAKAFEREIEEIYAR